MKAIDLKALDDADQKTFDASLRASQAKLDALRPYMKQFSISAIGNSHIDMAWLWPWTETVEVVRNTFGTALDLMNEYPDFKFTASTAQAYTWIEEKYPEMFKQIQQRVKEGRWEVIGGMWVEPDLNMPDGESLVRQILYGKNYFKAKFGVDIKIGWNPDSLRLQLAVAANLQALGHRLLRHPEAAVGARVHHVPLSPLLLGVARRQQDADLLPQRLRQPDRSGEDGARLVGLRPGDVQVQRRHQLGSRRTRST